MMTFLFWGDVGQSTHFLCIGVCLRSWVWFSPWSHSSVLCLSTWMWPLLNSTLIVRPWWEPLRFYALSSTFSPMCWCFYIFSKWSWRAISVGSLSQPTLRRGCERWKEKGASSKKTRGSHHQHLFKENVRKNQKEVYEFWK